MNDATQVTRIEQSIEIEATPEQVFAVLTDPTMITRFAGGIEGAEVIEMPHGEKDFRDAKLELVTKSGNVLRAEVLESTPPRRLVVRDERNLTATWDIVDVAPGKVRLDNVIEGPIPAQKAQHLQYDADVKFQALQHILEENNGHVDKLPSAGETPPGRGPA